MTIKLFSWQMSWRFLVPAATETINLALTVEEELQTMDVMPSWCQHQRMAGGLEKGRASGVRCVVALRQDRLYNFKFLSKQEDNPLD